MSGSRNIHWRGEVTSLEEAWHTDAEDARPTDGTFVPKERR